MLLCCILCLFSFFLRCKKVTDPAEVVQCLHLLVTGLTTRHRIYDLDWLLLRLDHAFKLHAHRLHVTAAMAVDIRLRDRLSVSEVRDVLQVVLHLACRYLVKLLVIYAKLASVDRFERLLDGADLVSHLLNLAHRSLTFLVLLKLDRGPD